eukprot:Pgem_evm1s11438
MVSLKHVFEQHEPQVVTKTDLNIEGKLAFTLDNVFSRNECEQLISVTEKEKYEEALVNTGGGRQVLMSSIRK